jgi:hypothetical protein
MAHVANAPAAARQTLAGANAITAHLPSAQATEVLHVARNSFTSGVNITGVIGVAIFASLVLLVVKATESGPTKSERHDGDVSLRERSRNRVAFRSVTLLPARGRGQSPKSGSPERASVQTR